MKTVEKVESIGLGQSNRYGRKARWMSGMAAATLQSKAMTNQANVAANIAVLTHGKRPRYI